MTTHSTVDKVPGRADRTNVKVYVRCLHRWLGLLAASWFTALGLTGSALVFHQEIDAWFNPDLLRRHSATGDIGIAQALAARPAGITVSQIVTPTTPDGVYRLRARSGGGTSRELEIFVDPGSGSILGQRPWRQNPVAIVYDLHSSLLGGTMGRNTIGGLGLVLLVSLGSGLYLWWPRGGRIRQALRIKRHAPPPRRNYDLHKLCGLTAVILLSVSAVTGVAICFPNVTRSLISATLPSAATAPITASSAFGPKPQLHQITQTVLQSVPGSRIARVWFPDENRDHYRLAVRRNGETGQSGNLTATVAPTDGSAIWLTTVKPPTTPDLFMSWQLPLHNGQAFGIGGRLVMLTAGVLPLGLATTGILLWRSRLQSRRSSRSLPLP